MLEIVKKNNRIFHVFRGVDFICDIYSPIDNGWVVSEINTDIMFIDLTSEELRQLADKLDELNDSKY